MFRKAVKCTGQGLKNVLKSTRLMLFVFYPKKFLVFLVRRQELATDI
jgi:hypothetical protein